MKCSITGKIHSAMFQHLTIMSTWRPKKPEYFSNWNGKHFYPPVKQQIHYYEKSQFVTALHSEGKDRMNLVNITRMKRLLKFMKDCLNIQE